MAKSKITITESGPVDAVPMDLVPAERPAEQALELKIIEEQVGFITTNAKDLLAMAKEKCAEYADVSRFIGHEDYAKKEKAALNNAEKKAASMASEVTKRWNAPLEEFAATMKEVRTAFKGASQALDVGIKDAEKKEADKKTADIRAYFDTKKFDLVPFEQLFNDRWLLKGSKMKDIEKELDARIAEVYQNIELLERIGEHGFTAKALYLQTLDIGTAMRQVDELKANAERLAREQIERENRKLEEQVQTNRRDMDREEQEAVPQNERVNDLARQALDLPEPEIQESGNPEILEFTCRFWGMKQNLIDMRRWMSEHNIAYEKID